MNETLDILMAHDPLLTAPPSGVPLPASFVKEAPSSATAPPLWNSAPPPLALIALQLLLQFRLPRPLHGRR
jgi:hypothetical protein